MLKWKAKLVTLCFLFVFSSSLLLTPTPYQAHGVSAADSENLRITRTPINRGTKSDLPSEYTRVDWDKGTVNDEWTESWNGTHYEFGPTITWHTRNATDTSLIGWSDTIPLDGWINLILRVPKNVLSGRSPYAIVFQAVYFNMSKIGPEGHMGEFMTEDIAAMGMYVVPETRWDIYSTTNATSMREPPPIESPWPGITLEDIYGPTENPFAELNSAASVVTQTVDYYVVSFNMRLNQSAEPGFYQIRAVAVDDTLFSIAESISDELSGRMFGVTFDDLVNDAVGGYYSWERLSDDGSVVLSATRGVDFNMTATITNGTQLANASVSFDIPGQILAEQWIHGPYTVTEEVQGAWQYDIPSGTYFWNASVNVTWIQQLDGLHPVVDYAWVDLSVEYQYYDPHQDKWVTDWTWPKQAVVYHFHNDSFTTNLVYDFRGFEWIDDPWGGKWIDTWFKEYLPWPSDGGLPQSYVLNESMSGSHKVGQNHVVNFRGHISEDLLPTGGEFGSGPLWVDDRVFDVNGKGLARTTDLPIATEADRAAGELLRRLAIESPTAVVRLTHKGKPYHPSWMFHANRGETFTVNSMLQGGVEFAEDIDGIGLVLRGWDDKMGFDAGEEWWQHSEVEVQIRVDSAGRFETKVYNYTQRTAWSHGEHVEEVYVEVIPGVWEWQPTVVVSDYWQDLWWDHEIGDWTTEWFPFQDRRSVMLVDYFDVGNYSYAIRGDDISVRFDVTPRSEIPDMEWNWDFYYGNLTWVVDYEAGEDLHLVAGWIEDKVYSFENATRKLHITQPFRDKVFRNNDTDELYMQKGFPYIVIGGQELPVKSYYDDTGTGTLEERVVFEKWDPEGWDPNTQAYSGAWVYWYELENGTQIPIRSGNRVLVYNITLDTGRWFLSFDNWTQWNPFTNADYLLAINGTPIVVGFGGVPIHLYNSSMIDRAPAFATEKFVVYANVTTPIYLAVEPIWEYDHYVLYLNDTYERVDVWYDEFLGMYFYWNMTDSHLYLFDCLCWHRLFRADYTGTTYWVEEPRTRFFAFAKISGTNYPLPYPGADVWSIWDLNFATMRNLLVYIEGAAYPIQPIAPGWDPFLGYSYPQFQANVSGSLYNLTFYGYDPAKPFDPMGREYLPFTAVANGTIMVPELFWHDWTVAIGHTDHDSRRFVVDDRITLVSGQYDTFGPNEIFYTNATHTYVVTSSLEEMNFTRRQRAYFFNVTLDNGTIIYTPEPFFYTVDEYNDTTGFYEVQYYYFIDLNGSEVRLNEWPEFTFKQLNSTVVNEVLWEYEFQGNWYDLFRVSWEEFYTIDAMNGTSWEVIDLMNDWEMKFNFPSFEFSIDGGLTWYNVTGNREMIYRSYWTHGLSEKLDYTALPVTVLRDQHSIVIGAPRFDMWDLETWTVNEENGALDLDGDLTTTDDQYYVQGVYDSTSTYNRTEEYLWVSITWEPNSTLISDEFHLSSFTGMVTFNWSSTWSDNYLWYHAETGERVNSTEMTAIHNIILDAEGFPNPGYWGIGWMSRNFTSDDLKAQAETEGWEWYGDSQEWSWIWWELDESYSVEVNNGTYSDLMDISLAYEYAGMLAWNDTDSDSLLDVDREELTHYWMPADVDSATFVTPGESWGNSNSTDTEYRAVNETINFGVRFYNVSGMVFPFGERSYWDWYDGQYYGSDFASFEERPSFAEVDEFSIDVHFTGHVNQTGLNYAAVKFDMLFGDWFVDTPGGDDVLDDYSLAVSFYSDLALTTSGGTDFPATYFDEAGQSVKNDETVASSSYTMGSNYSDVALMTLGGEPYRWSRNTSMPATVTAQTVPISTFNTMYVSDAGGSATAFNVTSTQFYTLIAFNYWDGFEVEVDPVFVGYISRGVSGAVVPTPLMQFVSSEMVDVDGADKLRLEIAVFNIDVSEIIEVKVWDYDNNVNYTATWSDNSGTFIAHIDRTQDGQYPFDCVIVVVDILGNEILSNPQRFIFGAGVEPPPPPPTAGTVVTTMLVGTAVIVVLILYGLVRRRR